MKKLSVVIVILCTLSLSPISHAQSYIANLDGSQDVPPVSLPVGDGQASFSLTGTTFSVIDSSYALLAGSPVGTLNDAAPGADGPVLFPFTMSNDGPIGWFSGSVTLTAGEITDLNAGDLYVNISDVQYPNGAIRGEILSVPEPSTLALIGAGSLAWLARLRLKGTDKSPLR